MKQQIQSKLALFVSNSEAVRKDFIWQSVLLKRLSALLYAAENRVVDCVAIRESFDMIKENTNIFSAFRGNSKMCIATMLSLSNDRRERLSNTIEVYEEMKKASFWASDYLAIAAYQVAANAQPADYAPTIERMRAFYDGMKKQHFFITGADDTIYAAMLGLSGLDVSVSLARIEELYSAFKPVFHSRSGVQALAQVMVLGEKPAETEPRVLQLRDAFRERRIRLDREYTLPSLGVLALLRASADIIADEVLEAYEFLRTQKGFGGFSVTKQELLLLCAGLAALGYLEDKKEIANSAITTSIASIIIAQQAALAAAAAASAAAASSSG